ncbi:hypothetical protein phytr_3300 [Candidatus Phycorickettsia trachydisci]|uniref:Uncharacterized protein n=1 Tax=Candidatus Phycorickettsia trachydisci TaxID=2115978 RepID=A0A2P1P7P3_9RICK|nr:hypothetical protein [Candidatus Phycorickettsia trachydisci]AVP87284.1 hypothetical protein phytr_3300 [Candidatus Phycorickettsia trachydisci]
MLDSLPEEHKELAEQLLHESQNSLEIFPDEQKSHVKDLLKQALENPTVENLQHFRQELHKRRASLVFNFQDILHSASRVAKENPNATYHEVAEIFENEVNKRLKDLKQTNSQRKVILPSMPQGKKELPIIDHSNTPSPQHPDKITKQPSNKVILPKLRELPSTQFGDQNTILNARQALLPFTERQSESSIIPEVRQGGARRPSTVPKMNNKKKLTRRTGFLTFCVYTYTKYIKATSFISLTSYLRDSKYNRLE